MFRSTPLTLTVLALLSTACSSQEMADAEAEAPEAVDATAREARELGRDARGTLEEVGVELDRLQAEVVESAAGTDEELRRHLREAEESLAGVRTDLDAAADASTEEFSEARKALSEGVATLRRDLRELELRLETAA